MRDEISLPSGRISSDSSSKNLDINVLLPNAIKGLNCRTVGGCLDGRSMQMVPNFYPPSSIQPLASQLNFAPAAPMAPISPQYAVQMPGYPKSRFDGVPQFERKAPISVVRKYFPAPRVPVFSSPINVPYPMPNPNSNDGMSSQVINDLTRALDRQQMSGEMQQITNTLASTMLNTMVMANHQHDHEHEHEDHEHEDIHIHEQPAPTEPFIEDTHRQEPDFLVHENHIYHHYDGHPPDWDNGPGREEIHHHIHHDHHRPTADEEDDDEDEEVVNAHHRHRGKHTKHHHYHRHPKKNEDDEDDEEEIQHRHHHDKQTNEPSEDLTDVIEKTANKPVKEPQTEVYGEMAAIVTSRLLQKLKAEHLINTGNTDERPIHVDGPTNHPVEQHAVDEKTNTITKVSDPTIPNHVISQPQDVPKILAASVPLPLDQPYPPLIVPKTPTASFPLPLEQPPPIQYPQVQPISRIPSEQNHISIEQPYVQQFQRPQVQTISHIPPVYSLIPPVPSHIPMEKPAASPVITQPLLSPPLPAHIVSQPLPNVVSAQTTIPLVQAAPQVPIRPPLTINNRDTNAEGHDAAQVLSSAPDINTMLHNAYKHIHPNDKNDKKESSNNAQDKKKVQSKQKTIKKVNLNKKLISSALINDKDDSDNLFSNKFSPNLFIDDDKSDENSLLLDDSSGDSVNRDLLNNIDVIQNDLGIKKDDTDVSELEQASSNQADADKVSTKKLYNILSYLDSIDTDKDNENTNSDNIDDLANKYLKMIEQSSSKQKELTSSISPETLKNLELLNGLDQIKKARESIESSRALIDVDSKPKTKKVAKKENHDNLYQRVLNKAIQKAAHRLSNETSIN